MQSLQSLKGISQFFQDLRQGRLKTFVPLLPLFYLRGKPMALSHHYQFAPMYNVIMPSQQLWMTGRQVGKSFGISSSTGLKCALVPFFHTMIVQPRADQIQRLNNSVIKPLLEGSPAQPALIEKTQIAKMALKQFKSGSLLYLDYCFLSPDRLRGASGLANIILDEVQDIEFQFLPVIRETTSASEHWGYTQYAGTPKTTDTTLGLLWQRTSKAQWIIKCQHCGHYNIPNPEQHMLKMIGKTGIICYHCGKDLDTSTGRWQHQITSRALQFPGYHISQLIHPFHLDKDHPIRWQRLLAKVRDYGTLQLYNEVLGWPYDESTSPLLLKDLLDSRHNIHVETPQDVQYLRRDYRAIAIGVDWSGGAALSDSYTDMAVAGLRNDSNTIDILYGHRFPKHTKPHDEASQVMRWVKVTGADILAHDNSGPGGFLRMQIMKQLGVLEPGGPVVVPYTYVGTMLGDTIRFHQATRDDDHYYYAINKARSLAIMIQALKDHRIRIPDFKAQDTSHYNYDYLALREDPRQTPGNNTIMYIIKKPGVPDDHAHATNFAVSALWDHFRIYPKLGTPAKLPTPQQSVDIIKPSYQSQLQQIYGPRSQYTEFLRKAANRAEILEPEFEDWSR